MEIKAIGFDIGGTLVNYNKPLNWSASYENAIRFMCKKNNLEFTDERFKKAKSVLEKYNTRLNPREKEVSSDTIFGEIFKLWNEDNKKIFECKKSFYLFFQREANLYDDTKTILKYCKKNNIKTAVYTDVAYGMDDEFSLNDIKEISEFIDLKLTSRIVGFRKPNKKGFEKMLQEFSCKTKELLYVGDEKKDIEGIEDIGGISVLINRENDEKDFGQNYTVKTLDEIINIIEKINKNTC